MRGATLLRLWLAVGANIGAALLPQVVMVFCGLRFANQHFPHVAGNVVDFGRFDNLESARHAPLKKRLVATGRATVFLFFFRLFAYRLVQLFAGIQCIQAIKVNVLIILLEAQNVSAVVD